MKLIFTILMTFFFLALSFGQKTGTDPGNTGIYEYEEPKGVPVDTIPINYPKVWVVVPYFHVKNSGKIDAGSIRFKTENVFMSKKMYYPRSGGALIREVIHLLDIDIERLRKGKDTFMIGAPVPVPQGFVATTRHKGWFLK
jgi:hypothetical protein